MQGGNTENRVKSWFVMMGRLAGNRTELCYLALKVAKLN
jgi:hypothetical protein